MNEIQLFMQLEFHKIKFCATYIWETYPAFHFKSNGDNVILNHILKF